MAGEGDGVGRREGRNVEGLTTCRCFFCAFEI